MSVKQEPQVRVGAIPSFSHHLKGANMDNFKKANVKLATSWDWNAPQIVKRHKGDGRRLRRYARRKLKRDMGL